MEISSRRQVEKLVSMGKYLEAEQTLRRNRDIKAMRKLELQKQLEEEQSIQWQAFSRAKSQYFMNANIATAANQETKALALHRKNMDDRLAHEEELESFATREGTVVMRRPVALSQQVVRMRRQERQLGLQGRYAEADRIREAAARLEAAERKTAMAENQRLLRDKVAAREKLLKEKEHISYKNSRAKMLLEQFQADRSMLCTTATLAHMEADMSSMHAKQRRDLQKLGYVPHISDAQLCKARRGTMLQDRVFGDKYAVPSLCDLYGPLLDLEAVPLRDG